MTDHLDNQPVWRNERDREAQGCSLGAPPASRSCEAERPRLTEELRHQVSVRILDALLSLDEGRSDEMDTHLRWVEVLAMVWGGDYRPLIPDVHQLRSQSRQQECGYEYRHPGLYGQIGAGDLRDAASAALAAAHDDVAEDDLDIDVLVRDLQVRCVQPGACGHSRHWAFVMDLRPDLG